MTTKQEALELLLTECRKWETMKVTPGEAWADAVEVVVNLNRLNPEKFEERDAVRVREALAILGGAALLLLIDEVEPVVGKDLDVWLAEGGNGGA